MPDVKTILYVFLGLSLGSGLTLLALQERFVRERRRLLAIGESQRAKSAQAAVTVSNKQWEQKCQEQAAELRACQEQLAAVEAIPAPIDLAEYILRTEHERLIHEKNTELSRLAAEHKTIATHLSSRQEEIKELDEHITYLKGEITRLQEEKKNLPDDDFLLLGQPGSHLLPGSVVRAFIKGH